MQEILLTGFVEIIFLYFISGKDDSETCSNPRERYSTPTHLSTNYEDIQVRLLRYHNHSPPKVRCENLGKEVIEFGKRPSRMRKRELNLSILISGEFNSGGFLKAF